MGFDSISSVPLPVLNNKDFAKKKRTNRLAKLKQSKLDVRREQWLSQVKNKGCKMDSIGKGESPQSPIETVDKQKPSDGSESRSRVEETESSSINDSDIESLMSSPVGSSLDHSDSSKGHNGTSSNSSSSSSTSSGYSSQDDEDCLDNWETIADALIAKENNEPNPVSDSNTVSDTPKVDGTEVVTAAGSDANSRAWRSDDASRPQSLPNPSKQHSFVTNSHRQCSHGAINRAWQSVMSHPSSCPICCEDLDVTDTSFIPCSCGFRLCLFCHKRILEADGRCPGCRKHYDPSSENSRFNGGLSLSPFRIAQ